MPARNNAHTQRRFGNRPVKKSWESKKPPLKKIPEPEMVSIERLVEDEYDRERPDDPMQTGMEQEFMRRMLQTGRR